MQPKDYTTQQQWFICTNCINCDCINEHCNYRWFFSCVHVHMCESLWFSGSVSLSCSAFTIGGYLTTNKYNTNGEIINTICLNLLVSSQFGKHYRSCTCLRIHFCFHQLQICFAQAMIVISDTVSQHHPLPQSYKGHGAHSTRA